MVYMITFTINIPPMLAYIPYMDPTGMMIYVDVLAKSGMDDLYLICSMYGIFAYMTGWFLWHMLVCIFQHHGSHMGTNIDLYIVTLQKNKDLEQLVNSTVPYKPLLIMSCPFSFFGAPWSTVEHRSSTAGHPWSSGLWSGEDEHWHWHPVVSWRKSWDA